MRLFYFLVGLAACLAVDGRARAVDLFWNDDDGIHRLDPAGPGDAVLYDTFQTRGIAVDPAGQRLWWSDVLPLGAPIPPGVIRSGGAQGGTSENVVTHLHAPAGVAVDVPRGKVFWTELAASDQPSAVYSANLDGSDPKQLISGPWLSEIEGISIDSLRGDLYFTYINPLIDAVNTGGIARADLDGGNVEPVVGGLAKPIGIAVDPYGGGIYWTDAGLSDDESDGRIQAANLDGQVVRTILGGLDEPYGVALDLKQRDVYWTDMGTGVIQMTHMSGILPFFTTVASDLKNPTALTVPRSEFRPGDATGDDRVDRADIAVVARNYGRSGASVNWFTGDFNGDSLVSQADLAILQAGFGPAGPGATTAMTAAVPEPATASAVVVAVLIWLGVLARKKA